MVEELNRIARERIPFYFTYGNEALYDRSGIRLNNQRGTTFYFFTINIINEDTISFELIDSLLVDPRGIFVIEPYSVVVSGGGTNYNTSKFYAKITRNFNFISLYIYYFDRSGKKFDIWLNNDNVLGYVPPENNRGFIISARKNIYSIDNSFIDFKTVISKVAKNDKDYNYLYDRCKRYLRQGRKERLLEFLNRLKHNN